MGNKKHSRRHFFRSLAAPAETDKTGYNDNDPLFQKYSRKKQRPRHYSTDTAVLKIGIDEPEPIVRVGNVTSGLAPYTGTWSEWEVLHLLRRTNFGWKKAWVDSLRALSPSAAVDAVLNISTTPPHRQLTGIRT
jgi:hypothetical protein